MRNDVMVPSRFEELVLNGVFPGTRNSYEQQNGSRLNKPDCVCRMLVFRDFSLKHILSVCVFHLTSILEDQKSSEILSQLLTEFSKR